MFHNRLIRFASLGLTTGFISACAVGNVAPVATPSHFAINYKGAGTVAVAVRDQRKEVLDGSRKETVVGRQRSLYGIPYSVTNASGRPFAADFSDLVVNGLTANGVKAQTVLVSPLQREDDAIAALIATGSNRNLFFNVVEWNADTYNRTTLHYDIKLSVLDSKGYVLGQTALAGEDVLGKGRLERVDMPTATADIIQSLLTTKPIVAALQPDAIASTKNCTVNQILKMQESGLAKQQIEAACPTR